jgi:hypothetical protein
VINLEFVEAIYRRYDGKSLYPSSRSIFGELKESDKGLESKIYQKLYQYISREDNCYFPSARGNHVDHILARNVGEIFAEDGYNISYYRDFFYKGENYDKKNYVKKYVKFESECLLRKVEAMRKYKSQIDMLFGDSSIVKYYLLENQKGEVYYEKK